ncbi:MAG: 50S ribosomal protein L10 [Candidatus Colwellbacteria bacterium]|nr:50S ribosomal protein L10 [Candidatus Colwellbacteria bacterium]
MAITRAKKEEIYGEGSEKVSQSRFLIFADFAGVGVTELQGLRRGLTEAGAKFKVIKKRILRLVLREKGFDFDPVKFEGQVGTVFGTDELENVIASVYKFSKDNEGFKILGGLDLGNKEELSAEKVIAIGKLPGREVLLAQLVGTMIAPVKKLMYVLDTLSKRS